MRNLVFEERSVSTREAVHIKLFSIEEIESHFYETLTQIMNQIKLADILCAQGSKEEANEILRSQVVLVEAAYDYFLHELLRLGVMNLYKGYWEDKGKKYMELLLPMKVLQQALSVSNDDWLKEWITEKYSYITLMDFEIFKKEVCGLLGINIREVADLAFYKLSGKFSTAKQLENEITEIYHRRNMIAHQSDRKMGTAEREEISREYVLGKIKVIEKIVMSLCAIVKEKEGLIKNPKDIGIWIKDLRSRLVNILKNRIVEISSKDSPPKP